MTIDARADAPALRREIYGASREPARADVERLIAIGRAAETDAEFADLLADVALDVCVRNADPPGSLSGVDEAWLAGLIGGGLSSETEFELLKRLMGQALSAPPELTRLAVREVERAIRSGRRHAIGGVELEAGVVTDSDVEALRAVSLAPTRGYSLRVTRETAEALFDIAHATAGAANSEAFPDFFARAVTNYLTGVDFLAAADSAEGPDDESLGGFGALFAAMFHEPPDLALTHDGFAPATDDAGAQADEDEAGALMTVDADEPFGLDDGDEADELDEPEEAAVPVERTRIGPEASRWLIDHLAGDGKLTVAERCLLDYMRDEAALTSPELEALFAEAA